MSRLKKIFILFLILVIAFPGQTTNTFSFVPKFIEHYQHHNKAHHQISLLGFIFEHMSAHQHHDSNQDHHDDCPLNQKHSLVHFVYVFKRIPNEIISQGYPLELNEKVQLPAYHFTFSEYNGNIWQPPKIA